MMIVIKLCLWLKFTSSSNLLSFCTFNGDVNWTYSCTDGPICLEVSFPSYFSLIQCSVILHHVLFDEPGSFWRDGSLSKSLSSQAMRRKKALWLALLHRQNISEVWEQEKFVIQLIKLWGHKNAIEFTEYLLLTRKVVSPSQQLGENS